MEKDSREFRLSEAREKLDHNLAIEDVALSGDAKQLRPQTDCDLRKSLAWDTAFFTSPGVLDPDELFETLNFRVEGRAADAYVKRDDKTRLVSLSSKPERTNGESEDNARTSLAWNSAFFTNPGVLDQEELSLVNSGFLKAESGITKDELWKSTDSTSSSTVKNSRFSVASIEIDLFDDLRASLRKPGTIFNVADSNVKPGRGIKLQENQSAKESAAPARSRSKPLLPSGRQRTESHGRKRVQEVWSFAQQTQTSMSHQKAPQILRGTKTPTAAPATKNSLPKQLKNSIGSSGAECGRNMSMHKKSCPQERSGRKPARKSPYSGSVSSPMISSRRKADPRLTASDSTFKTPSKFFNGGDECSVRSGQLRQLSSTPKSCHASPACSTDGCSSGSATSLNQISLDSTSNSEMKNCRSVLFDCEGFSTKLSPMSDCVLKDMKSSGLRLPLPKIGFFDADNLRKENRKQMVPSDCESARKRGSRNTEVVSGAPNDETGNQNCRKSSKTEEYGIQRNLKSRKGSKITDRNVPRAKKPFSGQSKSQSVVSEDNKENIGSFDKQMIGLSRDVEAIDINGDLVIELKAEKEVPFSFSLTSV